MSSTGWRQSFLSRTVFEKHVCVQRTQEALSVARVQERLGVEEGAASNGIWGGHCFQEGFDQPTDDVG